MNPREHFHDFERRLAEWNDSALFISVATADMLEPLFRRLDTLSPESLPLYGMLFAIKDNIDWEPLLTTAGCPEFAYQPAQSATAVGRLIDAGAIPVGKTNLDQFATGLVGTRSPYGVPRNAVNARYIPGGSSSGSASAVAAGLVDFSLGTDTAGSGRVPAAFQNLVGYKPTKGAVSTKGVVPACRSLDCVSVFAQTTAQARRVAAVLTSYDADDPYSRPMPVRHTTLPLRPTIGVPLPSQRVFADAAYGEAYERALVEWQTHGAELVEIDMAPLLETAQLLYGGPWVAERLAAVGSFWQSHPLAFHPVTRQVLATGEALSARSAFEASYQLEALRRKAEALWSNVDLMLTPTAVTLPTLEQTIADPLRINSLLGTWTNFMNLLDLCALALPAAPASDGRPFGVTVVAPAGCDELLWQAADLLEKGRRSSRPWGRTTLAVAGAHLKGLPLNGQLVERGARFLAEGHTAQAYKLYTFTDGKLRKPGLVRSESGGIRVPVELWDLPQAAWGSFLALIPYPLGLGKVELEDGSWVTGFVMDASYVGQCSDITAWGGWRAYLNSLVD